MHSNSLQALIDEAGGALNLARAHKYDRLDAPADLYPDQVVPQVPPEYSRWEREGRSYRETVALFDQSHHMAGVIITGPDAHRFLCFLACNNLTKSKADSAHQIICVNHDGQLIGDCILFNHGDDRFSAYGGGFVPNWICFQAETAGFDVTATRDERSPGYAYGSSFERPHFRFQIQGPKAAALINKLNGGSIGDVGFFKMTTISVGGRRYPALRHGMAGAPGIEFWGPWEERQDVRQAVLEAGQEFGIAAVGAMAYLVTGVESGWFQAPLPAIYSGETMRPYREWLPGNYREGMSRLAGSANYKRIEDYYLRPADLGFGRLVHMDHEFIGRDAVAGSDPEAVKVKVALRWNEEDVGALMREMGTLNGKEVRVLHLPSMADKFDHNYDTLTKNGREVGTSNFSTYSISERSYLSIGLVNQDVKPGDDVVIHWGEVGGGYGNAVVPATDLFEIRATVHAVPYMKSALDNRT